MGHHFDSFDNSLVIENWEDGIASNPYTGIADARNVNLLTVKGEASVGFATAQFNSTVSFTGTVSVSDGANLLTFTGGTIDATSDKLAIKFAGTVPTGVTAGNTYWIKYISSTTMNLYADYQFSGLVSITGVQTGATFTFYQMGKGKYFVKDKSNNSYMLDALGQLWSNRVVTTTNKYWTFLGQAKPVSDTRTTMGNGLALYQGSTGTEYIFVFLDAYIDYLTLSGLFPWVWGWNPSLNNTINALANFNVTAVNTIHEAYVGQDNVMYWCDDSFLGSVFEIAGQTFNPLSNTTYTYAQQALKIPRTDTAQCIAELGTNLLVGGKNNAIYPWDRTSTSFRYPLLLAEYNILRMVTVNTNTYIFVGNRGRIYITNGSQAELYKKIPDHISGTVEPYYLWGGSATLPSAFAISNKNQLYFSFSVVQNDGTTAINQYGGLWAVDLDERIIRLTNKLSYGTYAGYASAIFPITSGDPAGAGLFIGWSSGGAPRSVSDGVTNSTTTITSATMAFVAGDVGATITGVGIPAGTTIASVTNATTAIMSAAATATATGVTFIFPAGLDQTTSNPYTGSQATIDSDLIPIGTFDKPRDFTRIEYKLTKPLVAGESITIKQRLIFNTSNTGYTTVLTDNTVGNYSLSGPINFKNAQWVQFQIVLNSTATTPSFVRLKQIRITGLVGPTLQTSQQLSL